MSPRIGGMELLSTYKPSPNEKSVKAPEQNLETWVRNTPAWSQATYNWLCTASCALLKLNLCCNSIYCYSNWEKGDTRWWPRQIYDQRFFRNIRKQNACNGNRSWFFLLCGFSLATVSSVCSGHVWQWLIGMKFVCQWWLRISATYLFGL